LLALASPAAAARWDLSPTFPWSFSANGTEASTGLAVGFQDSIWLAGNVTNGIGPATGRDVLVLYYSFTQTAVAWSGTHPARPLSATMYDRAGMDEGPPSIVTLPHNFGTADTENESFLAFTTTGEGIATLSTWHLRGPFLPNGGGGSTSPWNEPVNGNPTGAAGIAVAGTGTPYSVGWVTANGVDQLLCVRQVRTSLTAWGPRVTATFWTGSLTLSVTGRAIGVDGAGVATIAAQSGGDLVLFRYTAGTYQNAGPLDLYAVPAPGFPRRFVTPGWDEPRQGVLDGDGSFLVAGSIDATGAVWKFDEAGNASPGFPVRLSQGPAVSFRALAVDGDHNIFVTGASGSNLVVMGYDRAGRTLPGLPLTVSAGADSVEGCGIGVDSYGAIWIAATVTAAPATWGGTRIALYRYLYTPDPPPVAPGEVRVRGPEGAVLNLLRGEKLAIQAWPIGAGTVRVQVRTLRGELVRQLENAGPGHEYVSIEWDGNNAAGEPVASGTYGLLVTGGGLKVVKRVVVIRRP
jgi:hypothetical protein